MAKATAKEFAAKGWNVIATMRRPNQEKELSQIDNILVNELDLAKKDTIEAAIESGIRQFGKIDVLINNAGVGVFGVFEATPEKHTGCI